MTRIVIRKPYRGSRIYNIIDESDKIIGLENSEKRAIRVAKNKIRAGHDLYISKLVKVVSNRSRFDKVM